MYVLYYTYIMKTNLSTTDSLQQKFLSDLVGLWPLAKGCVTQVWKPCIQSGCRACREGRKHPAFIFTYRQAGKAHCLYVPESFVPVLRRAIRNGRKLEQKLVTLGHAMIKSHRLARKNASE